MPPDYSLLAAQEFNPFLSMMPSWVEGALVGRGLMSGRRSGSKTSMNIKYGPVR